MINEMHLLYEQDFKDIVRILKKKHNDKVANLLWDMEGLDFDKLRQTYIGLSDELGKASFTNHPEGKKRQLAKMGKVINSIIASIKAWGKEVQKEEDPTEGITEEDVYTFVTRYKGEQQLQKNMRRFLEVVEGEDIRKYYNVENYYAVEGDLGKSCMRHAHKSEFFDLYVENPKVCKMLILKAPEDTEKIIGRAILWTDVAIYSNKGYQMKFEKEGKLMDRIYTTEESLIHVFKNYANDHGYHYKEDQDNMEHFTAMYEGREDESAKFFTVEIEGDFYHSWPYMDTLKYFFKNNRIISNNDGYFGTECDMSLEEMDGSPDCKHCEGGHTKCPDCERGKQDCEDCDGRGSHRCGVCDGDAVVEIEGEDGETEEVDCEECGGTGEITCEYCGGDGEVDCPTCHGGWKDYEECDVCGGVGK